ncbi:hypothetical protein DPMN_041345 [Dreissena polymorpha]|uniref:Uncharacterized protein n=1 Tax=Dreissena polymorpha TaxID=45954 RepID=A0A9D4CYH1_DREPO|nr:hypothetical protein DPMN_041345 [Dreissena polymorpha]
MALRTLQNSVRHTAGTNNVMAYITTQRLTHGWDKNVMAYITTQRPIHDSDTYCHGVHYNTASDIRLRNIMSWHTLQHKRPTHGWDT